MWSCLLVTSSADATTQTERWIAGYDVIADPARLRQPPPLAG
jgi:hypothetical protein